MFYLLSHREYCLSNILLPFCKSFSALFYIILIIFCLFPLCSKVFNYISSPKYSLLVKIILVIIFQVYLYKLQVADIKFLIFV